MIKSEHAGVSTAPIDTYKDTLQDAYGQLMNQAPPTRNRPPPRQPLRPDRPRKARGPNPPRDLSAR